tara:strand:- start:987 stop:1244 length:258 start_codon:yes stop_codon:yes gene_type:complete
MPETQRLLEQIDSIQESTDEKIRVTEGGRISGVEGSLRWDLFDHDEDPKYDFSDDECPVCELPENALDIIIGEIEQEEANAKANI